MTALSVGPPDRYPPKGAEKERILQALPRRGFLKRLVELLYGGMTFLLAIPLVSYIVTPAFRREEVTWVDLGPAEAMADTSPKPVTFQRVVQDGWVKRRISQTAWVYRKEDGLQVISPTCTHLGCLVDWNSEKKAFLCPCHGGVYDGEGRVTGGPPPRPLDRYEMKIEQGRLLIGPTYPVDESLKPLT